MLRAVVNIVMTNYDAQAFVVPGDCSPCNNLILQL